MFIYSTAFRLLFAIKGTPPSPKMLVEWKSSSQSWQHLINFSTAQCTFWFRQTLEAHAFPGNLLTENLFGIPLVARSFPLRLFQATQQQFCLSHHLSFLFFCGPTDIWMVLILSNKSEGLSSHNFPGPSPLPASTDFCITCLSKEHGEGKWHLLGIFCVACHLFLPVRLAFLSQIFIWGNQDTQKIYNTPQITGPVTWRTGLSI